MLSWPQLLCKTNTFYNWLCKKRGRLCLVFCLVTWNTCISQESRPKEIQQWADLDVFSWSCMMIQYIISKYHTGLFKKLKNTKKIKMNKMDQCRPTRIEMDQTESNCTKIEAKASKRNKMDPNGLKLNKTDQNGLDIAGSFFSTSIQCVSYVLQKLGYHVKMIIIQHWLSIERLACF